MSPPDRAVVDRLLRWLPALLVAGALVGVACRAAVPLSDPDVWWHLRLGNLLIHQHSFEAPAWSPFGTRPWTPSEPVPEVVAALVERGFGLSGVAWLYGVALLALTATLYLTDRLRAHPLVASTVTAVTLLAASRSLTERPQLVSFALVAVVLAAWWATEDDLRPRWWLVPLTWGWSLCHGFWFIGVGLSALCWLGLVLDRRVTLRESCRLLLVPVGSLLVVLLNPSGLLVISAPFAVSDTKQHISEWQRTELLSPLTVLAMTMLAVTLVVWVVGRRLSFLRLLLLVSAAFLLWYANRTIALGAVVAAPLLAEALQSVVARSRTPGIARLPSVTRREVRWLAGGAAACSVALALAVPWTADEPASVPSGLDARLDQLPSGTTVFNVYDVGGWMAWRHPDLHRVIDGLVVPYPNDYVDRYFAALHGLPGWAETVRSTGARVALLFVGSTLAADLEQAGWSATSADGYVLLTAPGTTR